MQPVPTVFSKARACRERYATRPVVNFCSVDVVSVSSQHVSQDSAASRLLPYSAEFFRPVGSSVNRILVSFFSLFGDKYLFLGVSVPCQLSLRTASANELHEKGRR